MFTCWNKETVSFMKSGPRPGGLGYLFMSVGIDHIHIHGRRARAGVRVLLKIIKIYHSFRLVLLTSSPKGNDALLRAIIQSEKKWKRQFFRRLRAASSVVRGRIWPNFKLIQALMYVIITCKYDKDPIKNNQEKVATPFFKL